MADLEHRLEYRPVPHDHEQSLAKTPKPKGFEAALPQEEVAASIGTTKSAVSRLEAVGKHSPPMTTLKKYARAVGCEVEIHLVPTPR